jgi:hypothetical protein
MIFTKKYKPEIIEPLRLKRQKITFTNTLKYLGLLLDPKLNWKTHLIDKRKKFYSSMWVCRRAMGKTGRLTPRYPSGCIKQFCCQNFCMHQWSGGPWWEGRRQETCCKAYLPEGCSGFHKNDTYGGTGTYCICQGE